MTNAASVRAAERLKQKSKMKPMKDKLGSLPSKLFNRKKLRDFKAKKVSDPLNFPHILTIVTAMGFFHLGFKKMVLARNFLT